MYIKFQKIEQRCIDKTTIDQIIVFGARAKSAVINGSIFSKMCFQTKKIEKKTNFIEAI